MTLQEAKKILQSANTAILSPAAECLEQLRAMEEAMWVEIARMTSILPQGFENWVENPAFAIEPTPLPFEKGRALIKEFLLGFTGEAAVVVARQVARKLNLDLYDIKWLWELA
jgi:hypothetical protein